MNKPKMIIEVAIPAKEISAESVRDKSIRHGHISIQPKQLGLILKLRGEKKKDFFDFYQGIQLK